MKDKKKTKSSRKKKISILIISIIIFVIIILIFVFLFLPRLLLLALMGELLDNTNYQTKASESRMSQIIAHKINPNQSKSKYKIINDLRKSNPNLIHNLKQNGIITKTDGDYITDFRFNNKSYSSSELLTALKNDQDLYQAVSNSVSINRNLFQDQIGTQTSYKLGVNRSGYNDNDKDFDKQTANLIKSYDSVKHFNLTSENQEQKLPADLETNLKYFNNQADLIAKKGDSPIHQNFENYKLLDDNFVSNKSACGMIKNSQFIADHAKSTKTIQQTRLGVHHLAENFDKVKAGIATRESMEYALESFNQETNTTKPANKSFAFNHYINQKNPKMDESSNFFVLGANSTIAKTLKNQNNCNQSNNLFFGLFNLNNYTENPNLNQQQKTAITRQTVGSMANTNIGKNLKGEDLFNSIAGGVGNYTKEIAKNSGLLILPKDEAIAYKNSQDQLLAFKAKNVNTFDIKNNKSLIAKASLKTYSLTNSKSFYGFIGNLFNLAKTNLQQIFPNQTKADSDQYQKFSMCHDPEYLSLNKYLNGQEIAFDPNCNPIYGLPTQYLDINPEQVITELVNSNNLKITDCDSQGLDCRVKPINDLAKFEQYCINSETKNLGKNPDHDLMCISQPNNRQQKLYSLYFLDRRIQNIILNLEQD